MFYVIYLKNAARNVIVPQTWIFNYEIQMEKDMYFGVNPTQAVMCFYDPVAYNENGEPDKSVIPNFNMPVDEARFPNRGCYKGKIKMFKGKYNNCNDIHYIR